MSEEKPSLLEFFFEPHPILSKDSGKWKKKCHFFSLFAIVYVRVDVVVAPYPLSLLLVIAFCLLSIVKCVIMMYYSGRMFDNDIILSIDSA